LSASSLPRPFRAPSRNRHQIFSPPLFSYAYELPIFYPLCFACPRWRDIHACNGGIWPPSRHSDCPHSEGHVRACSAPKSFIGNTYGHARKCCKQKTCGRTNFLDATLTKKRGVGSHSHNQGLAGGGGLNGEPEPSLSVLKESMATFSNRSTRPLGQRTSTESIFVAAPRPKCTRISLFEM
jgi:hypothetical protein